MVLNEIVLAMRCELRCRLHIRENKTSFIVFPDLNNLCQFVSRDLEGICYFRNQNLIGINSRIELESAIDLAIIVLRTVSVWSLPPQKVGAPPSVIM